MKGLKSIVGRSLLVEMVTRTSPKVAALQMIAGSMQTARQVEVHAVALWGRRRPEAGGEEVGRPWDSIEMMAKRTCWHWETPAVCRIGCDSVQS